MNNEIELLELIAELNMSDDKSRKALGSEIKRLTDGMRAELAALEAALDEARDTLEHIVEYAERYPGTARDLANDWLAAHPKVQP